MLTAGMSQHWDELVSLERDRRALLVKGAPASPFDLPEPLIELIRQIQSCDAELREKLDAWMDHARILLRLGKQNSPKP
jgi:hypothetical protein